MNERIKKLRSQSRRAIPYLSLERTLLITEFYKNGAAHKYSAPVARAKAFEYILKNKEICFNNDELIVGERGPEPKATPTYPEICCHTLNDLEILDSREKISFKVQDEVWRKSKDIVIPFWKGKTIREKIFSQVDQEWVDAYSAGIYTEFMEQRAPGHTVAGRNIWNMGFMDFKKQIQISIENLDFYNDPDAFAKREQLKAMDIAADSIIAYAKRHSKKALNLAENESDPIRKKELEKIAEICSHVPAQAPRTFWEALQHYWFIHLGVITEYNTWDAFNPGRLDQHLYTFYRKDISDGILTKEGAVELLQAFWIKFNNQPAPPKVGITAEESGTYTDFCNINLGGLKEDGSDGVNELSYVLLDVIEDMRILQPSSNVQISEKTPDDFIRRALKIIKTGFGQPSVFNADAIVQELTRQGKSLVDARNGGASGCVETGAFGKEAYILTGYFNLVKILEVTLHNGKDPSTNKQIGIKTGDPLSFRTFDELIEAYTKQIKHFVDIKIKGNQIIERIWAQNPSPFLSILIDDCIINGKDYNDGGAKYNTSYIQIVGMGSITDCLTSLKYNIYDNQIITMEQMLYVLKNDFEGFEEIRQKLISRTPKYGNDKDYADLITQQVFEIVYNAIDGRPNTRGGVHRINLLPTTVHIYFGKVTGATPDGRKAYTPLSEGISPVQGMDINGPTSVIKSAGKIDHLRTGGTLLNQKFSPKFFSSESGINNVAHLIRSYFKMGGHHIQLNVVSANTLRAAQRNPVQYRNLIVRVAGYSDYYINLGKDLQDEIIKRTEHFSI
ncbi:MAG: formate C-acetyltransferase/glycerol dehydratase family glycyl radical enzyme [Promethearchaeota archaeon Loki_b31]|nr:MAG: formate C-acetyltransferase/glycerol dehydratase family glycyl radical enzyme [Candidatus Lokiarchaeota archaeon Loki_b31]